MNDPHATLHPKHRCRACGARLEQHVGIDYTPKPLACPPHGVKFPSWPSTVKDESKAGALFDKRVADYWQKSGSVWVAQ
jgi:hypothetical protein